MSKRSQIRSSKSRLFLSALSLIALTAAALDAQAQASVDQGDFATGDAGPAPNHDSEYVPGLGMQMPTYGGSGCPQGSISATLSPDQRSLSILFDNYVARAGGNSGAARVAMDCQVNIPFQVPPGYRVQVVKMDYRGFTMIPAGARSTFGAGFRYLEINGAATAAPRFVRAKVFMGPKQENFEVSSVMQGPHWSPCGKPFVLAADSYVNAMTNRSNEEVLTTVDSLDAVQLPVEYSLRWQRCNDQVGPRPDPRPGPPSRPVPPGRPGWPSRPPVRGR